MTSHRPRPITPPSELVQEWVEKANEYVEQEEYAFANLAAQWGADQELEACCEWLQDPDLNVDTYKLRADRRPQPPNLKEQALDLLDKAEDPSWDINDFSIVRRALEQLP